MQDKCLIHQTRKHPSTYHGLPEHKTAVSISVEVLRSTVTPTVVDLDASNHLVVQPPCLRHCHTSVRPVLHLPNPENNLSHSSLMIPWRFETKITKFLNSGISLPALWRCGGVAQFILIPNDDIRRIQNIILPWLKIEIPNSPNPTKA